MHIASWSKTMNDFSVFENLEQIGGVDLYRQLVALAIQDIDNETMSFMSHVRIYAFIELIVNLDVY